VAVLLCLAAGHEAVGTISERTKCVAVRLTEEVSSGRGGGEEEK